MTRAEETIRELVGSSPYPPEPPRSHLLVTAVMKLAELLSAADGSPHQSGGSDFDNVEWEYEHEQVEGFWSIVSPYATVELLRDKDVLDIGCGWGGKAIYYAQTARPRAIAGFDLPGVFRPDAPTQFAARYGLANCSFTTGRAEQIPFPDDSFDVALMEDVLEHVDDPAAVLAESARVLRPGGVLVARFPSIRMLRAHHFDRATTLPGLHYLLPMRTWAAGFNYYLVTHGERRFEPFSAVGATPFHPDVTRDLNGMDYQAARAVIAGSPLHVRHLELVAFPAAKFGRHRGVFRLYRRLRTLPKWREPLSRSIVLVAENPLNQDGGMTKEGATQLAN